MNFDQIKNDWNQGIPNTTDVSADMLKIKTAQTPIDIIRRKMKKEFFYQVIFLILMGTLPFVFSFTVAMTQVYFVFYTITCGFTAHYFYKFYRFYKNSYDMTLDTRKNILWFYYEMKLNIELYKALTYIVAFIWTAFLAVLVLVAKMWLLTKIVDKFPIAYILLNCFFTILIIGIITELWAWYYYGRYLNRLKKVVDDLNQE